MASASTSDEKPSTNLFPPYVEKDLLKVEKDLLYFSTFSTYFSLKRLIIFTKKPEIWKKYSVSIFIHVTVFSKMFPNLIWHFQSYLGRKKGTSETFLSLGLFISRPRPTASASKMRPRLRKTFPRFPFVYFGNLGKTQIRGQKFFLSYRSRKKGTEETFFEAEAEFLRSRP